jgi:hypothetical protein
MGGQFAYLCILTKAFDISGPDREFTGNLRLD